MDLIEISLKISLSPTENTFQNEGFKLTIKELQKITGTLILFAMQSKLSIYFITHRFTVNVVLKLFQQL